MQGNVLDLAIGVVMGTAFTAIVTALVEDIITPIIAAVSGNSDISDMTVSVGPANLGVGAFLQAVIDFLIIAVILFIIIKAVNTMTTQFKHEEEETDEVEAPTVEELLSDIKEILKEENQATQAGANVETADATITGDSIDDSDHPNA